jgi:hypothetical protein
MIKLSVNNYKLMYRIIKSFNKWPKNDFQNKTDFLILCLIVRLVQFLLIIVTCSFQIYKLSKFCIICKKTWNINNSIIRLYIIYLSLWDIIYNVCLLDMLYRTKNFHSKQVSKWLLFKTQCVNFQMMMMMSALD